MDVRSDSDASAGDERLRLWYRTAGRCRQRFAHALEEVIRCERLAQVARDPRFAGARLRHIFGVSRDDHGGNALAGRDQRLIQSTPLMPGLRMSRRRRRVRATRPAEKLSACSNVAVENPAASRSRVALRIDLFVIHDGDKQPFGHFASTVEGPAYGTWQQTPLQSGVPCLYLV